LGRLLSLGLVDAAIERRVFPREYIEKYIAEYIAVPDRVWPLMYFWFANRSKPKRPVLKGI